MSALIDTIAGHPLVTAVTAASAMVLLILAVLATRRAFRAFGRLRARVGDDHLLTLVAGGIGTCVAGQGMWAYFTDTVKAAVWLRILMFAFIEVMVISSAIRARRSMRAGHGTGVDGVAMWVLTCLSAVLASTHAASFGELLLRLSAPLVAAFGWERTDWRRINWRLSPERVLIRLGLADPTDRTASEVDAHRRLLRLAIATKRARTAGWPRRWWTLRRLDRAMEGAVEYGGLGTDPDSRDTLVATLGALVNASDLLVLRPPAPWAEQTAAPTFTLEPSGPSVRLPELEAGTGPAWADLRQRQTASDDAIPAGQPTAHNLAAAVISARADGMTYREIAEAFDIKRWRVEAILRPDNGSAQSDTPTEDANVSEIPSPTAEPSSEEPATEPRRPDRTGRRFAVRLRRWLVTAEEARPEPAARTANGHHPEPG
jgi:hypothetical protein